MFFGFFKRRVAFSCLCLVSGILFAAQLQASQPQTEVDLKGAVLGPSIQLPETQFDFGEASEADEVAHDFVVKNTGTDLLKIKQVRPG
jgi:hypothetical protein